MVARLSPVDDHDPSQLTSEHADRERGAVHTCHSRRRGPTGMQINVDSQGGFDGTTGRRGGGTPSAGRRSGHGENPPTDSRESHWHVPVAFLRYRVRGAVGLRKCGSAPPHLSKLDRFGNSEPDPPDRAQLLIPWAMSDNAHTVAFLIMSVSVVPDAPARPGNALPMPSTGEGIPAGGMGL